MSTLASDGTFYDFYDDENVKVEGNEKNIISFSFSLKKTKCIESLPTKDIYFLKTTLFGLLMTRLRERGRSKNIPTSIGINIQLTDKNIKQLIDISLDNTRTHSAIPLIGNPMRVMGDKYKCMFIPQIPEPKRNVSIHFGTKKPSRLRSRSRFRIVSSRRNK